MPEKHLSTEESIVLSKWLQESSDAIEISYDLESETSSWAIGENREPLIIAENFNLEGDLSANGTNLTYSSALKEKLREVGLIFEVKSEALPPMGAD